MPSRTFIGEGYGNQSRVQNSAPDRSRSYDAVAPSNQNVFAHPRNAYSAPSSVYGQSSGNTAPMMPPSGQYPPQYGQTNDTRYYDVSIRGGAFTGAVGGHPYHSSHPAPGVAGDAQTNFPILGIDISIADVEQQLRRLYNIPPNRLVDLYAIPDPPGTPFTQIAITQIAIWSSEYKRLTQAEIWSRIEQRFQSVRDPETAKKWKANIRHLLSLKKTFVKLPESRNGAHYWSLDYRYLESGGDKRVRKRGAKKARGSSDTRRQNGDDEEYDEEEIQDSDPHTKEESSSSPSPPSSYTGRGPVSHYERGYSDHSQSPGHPFNPSHNTNFTVQQMPPTGALSVEKYSSPVAYDVHRQPYRNQTYPPSHSLEPVFGHSSFVPLNQQFPHFRDPYHLAG